MPYGYRPTKRGQNKGTYYDKRECPVCGKEFEVFGKAEKERVYCSRSCHGKGREPVRKGVEVNKLAPSDAIWLAGFLDGEGSIMMIKRDNGSVALHLSIANTHVPTLEHVRGLLGFGNLNQTREATERHKATYLLRLNHEGAASLLRQIFPYMITKKEQARTAIEFAELKKDISFRADKEKQAWFHERMKMLNQRGNPQMAVA